MSASWKNNVVQSFDNKSGAYDQNCELQKTIAQRLTADLPKSGISNILEIGCGTGNLTRELLRLYPNKNFCITDIAPAMLEQAKVKFPNENINWQIFDGENPNTSQKYDLIVANMAFQWFEDLDSALTKLRAMLTPNGAIYYTMPSPKSFKQWTDILNKLNLPVGILDFQTHTSIYRHEALTIKYNGAMDFLRSIKNIGAGRPRKNYSPLNNAQLKQACDMFDKMHGGNITWQIMYGRVRNKK